MSLLTNMTNAEKYIHQKKLNRDRQKRWYDKNKERTLAQKNLQRSEFLPTEEHYDSIVEPPPVSSYEPVKKSQTNKTYSNNLKQFLRVSGCQVLDKTCLDKWEQNISIIENSKQISGKPYALDSKKGMIQAILKQVDSNPTLAVSDEAKLEYKKYFKKLDGVSRSNTKDKKTVESEAVPDFTKYTERVKKDYGEDSMFYLLTKLYSEATVRDNYGELTVVEKGEETSDKTKNYIIVPKKSGNAEVVINSYKTALFHDTIKVKLTKSLTKLIENYMKKNGISYGNFLFSLQKSRDTGYRNGLTDFVSKKNKEMGYTGGINLFRHMRISKLLQGSKIKDISIRQDLARDMGHSLETQLDYIRKIKE